MKPFDLKSWREKHNMTQAQASNALLISVRSIQRIEAGETIGKMNMLEVFCQNYSNKKARK